RDVLLLDGRTGDRPQADTELLADDVRERRLPEARRACEQHVVERLAARLRGDERDVELLLDALLPDELVERARPQRLLDDVLVVVQHRRDERAHAALRNASRTRSAAGSAASVSASARSASAIE